MSDPDDMDLKWDTEPPSSQQILDDMRKQIDDIAQQSMLPLSQLRHPAFHPAPSSTEGIRLAVIDALQRTQKAGLIDDYDQVEVSANPNTPGVIDILMPVRLPAIAFQTFIPAGIVVRQIVDGDPTWALFCVIELAWAQQVGHIRGERFRVAEWLMDHHWERPLGGGLTLR